MRVLATGLLLAGLWASAAAGARGAAPLPPRCTKRVELRAAGGRDRLVCATEVPGVVSLRDGDRLTAADGRIFRERMAGPALRLLHLPIDINGASVEDLQALPGIGPTLAARIAGGRPYRSAAELARVPGIGRKRLAALVPAVEADGR